MKKYFQLILPLLALLIVMGVPSQAAKARSLDMEDYFQKLQSTNLVDENSRPLFVRDLWRLILDNNTLTTEQVKGDAFALKNIKVNYFSFAASEPALMLAANSNSLENPFFGPYQYSFAAAFNDNPPAPGSGLYTITTNGVRKPFFVILSANSGIKSQTTSTVLRSVFLNPISTNSTQATPQTFTLTTNTQGNGTITGNNPTYTSGQTATITATPAEGNVLKEWTGACSGTSTTCTVVMNGNKSVGAVFEEVVINNQIEYAMDYERNASTNNVSYLTRKNERVYFDLLKGSAFYEIAMRKKGTTCEKELGFQGLVRKDNFKPCADEIRAQGKIYIVDSTGKETLLPILAVRLSGFSGFNEYATVRVDARKVRDTFPEGRYSLKTCIGDACGEIKNLKLIDIPAEDINILELNHGGNPARLVPVPTILEYRAYTPFTESFIEEDVSTIVRPYIETWRSWEIAQVSIGQNGNYEYLAGSLDLNGIGLPRLSDQYGIINMRLSTWLQQYTSGTYDLVVCLERDSSLGQKPAGYYLYKDGYEGCTVDKIVLENPLGTRVITSTSKWLDKPANPIVARDLPTPATPQTFILTTNTQGNGTITGNNPTYTSGQTATITATPAEGNVLKEWTGACRGTSTTCTVVMNGNKSVGAVFEEVVTPTPTTAVVTPTVPETLTPSTGETSIPSTPSREEIINTLLTRLAELQVQIAELRAQQGLPAIAPVTPPVVTTAIQTITFPTPICTMDIPTSMCSSWLTNGMQGTVRWSTENISSTATGTLSLIGVNNTETVITRQLPNTGVYSWNVNLPEGSYAVKIAFGSVTATNDIRVLPMNVNQLPSTPATDPVIIAPFNPITPVVETPITPQTFTLTTNTQGNGTITGNTKSSYNQGESVTLTATPGSNTTFTRWTGACSGTSRTCTLNMSSNKTVGAVFEQVATQVQNYTYSASAQVGRFGEAIGVSNGAYVTFDIQTNDTRTTTAHITASQCTSTVLSTGCDSTLKVGLNNGKGGAKGMITLYSPYTLEKNYIDYKIQFIKSGTTEIYGTTTVRVYLELPSELVSYAPGANNLTTNNTVGAGLETTSAASANSNQPSTLDEFINFVKRVFGS